ncbi:MAG: hypothetical protein J5I50_09385 [Chitinophagaceae bacterium]|nr:hypothetical protein [Chitinophagaceae bacterium]
MQETTTYKIKNYLAGWDLMRFIRLALGLLILIKGIADQNWAFAILGAAFSAMPIFNVGCCAGGQCAPPRNYSQAPQQDVEIEYEEVK